MLGGLGNLLSAEGFESRICYESGLLHARFSQFPDAVPEELRL